jgi:hypothetical protein
MRTKKVRVKDGSTPEGDGRLHTPLRGKTASMRFPTAHEGSAPTRRSKRLWNDLA